MRILSVSTVSVTILKSNPIQLAIHVTGTASTPGWTNVHLDSTIDRDPNDDVLELELKGEPPAHIGPQILFPVSTSLVYGGTDVERLTVIKVAARLNSLALHAQDWGKPFSPATPEPVGLTTMAVGEEGTTKRFGEEGPLPTTEMAGEETPTTLMLGEEGWPTTERFGEEGTTKAVGEEGPQTWPWMPSESQKTIFPGEEGPLTDPRVDDPMPPWRTGTQGEHGPAGGGGFGGPFGGF